MQLAANGLLLYKIREDAFAIALPQSAPAKISGRAAAEAPLVDTIIITGSRIPQANTVSASPVTTIKNIEFEIRGATRAEDVVNTLPQAFAAQGSNISNGATGTAQVSLRGLGPSRTLVLVNGHRLQYGTSLPTSGGAAPDLNQVPGSLVERIEVLTGGASAAYGSDAIAGVVNFIMMSDFEGVRIDGQLSGYQHGNNNSAAQTALLNSPPNPGSDFALPESGVFDGKGQNITLIIGSGTEDGQGNITAYAGYRNNGAILQADRDYSKCAYGGGDPEFRCTGSTSTPSGRFFTALGDFTLDENGPGDTFRARTSADTFNYNATNFYQRPDERFTLGAFAHYAINENLEFYSEAMLYDYRSDAQIAFTGTFFATSLVNCDNPLISTTPNSDGVSQLDAICGADSDNGTPLDPGDDFIIPGSGSAGAGDVPLLPGRRFVEGLPRRNSIRLTSYRMLGGVRGNVMEGWDYDAYFQYANTHDSRTYNNDAVTANIQNALFAVDDGAGNIVCRNRAARLLGCTPLDLFEVGGVTQEQLGYIIQPSSQDGNTKQYLAEGVLTGDLGVYGIQSPWADEGAGLAVGFQWRKDKLAYRPDALFEFGLLAGQLGGAPAVSGEIEAADLFAEVQLPLIAYSALAEALSLHGYYRHSDVSTSGSYSTWKLAGDWQVIPEVRIRGGWQRAARAANVIEAFSPQSLNLTTLSNLLGVGDLCSGSTPAATLAQCMNSGVTADQYGSIAGNPALLYNALLGGNPDLNPETSDTYTVGVVLTPSDYAPGNLLFSVDYFSIDVDGFISIVPPATTLNQCLTTGDPFFCDNVHRDAAGTLWQTPAGFIKATNLNTGSLSTSGLDFNFDWDVDFEEFGLGNAGGLQVDMVGTYLFDLSVLELPDGSVQEFDCAGWYGGGCGSPNPEWRHKLRTTWQTPLGVDATLTWRYFSSVAHGNSAQGAISAPTNQNFELESRNYIDLQGSYDVTENLSVRVGVNNLLDKDPPTTSQQGGLASGNTYPQTYDAQGRFLFVGATIDF